MGTIAHTTRTLGLRIYAEPQLVERALGGDALAFSELYRRYQPRVYGFCLARLLSPDAAQDACQEVFVRLLAADGQSVRSVGPWLFGTARHVCIDVARHDNRIEFGDEGLDSADALASARGAEAEALSRADAKHVLIALRRVRPRYRTALVMREIHGLPMRDIAEALGVGEGAAYTVLSRSRDAFGRAYAEVLDLPGVCADSVEMMYRRSGSGLSASEDATLEQHLSTCHACRKESLRAGDRSRLAVLLPLLPAASSKGLIAQAIATFGSQGAPSLQGAVPYVPFAQTAIAKTGAMLLVTGSVVAAVGYSGSMAASRLRLASYQSEEPSAAVRRSYGLDSSSGGEAFIRSASSVSESDSAESALELQTDDGTAGRSGSEAESGEGVRSGDGGHDTGGSIPVRPGTQAGTQAQTGSGGDSSNGSIADTGGTGSGGDSSNGSTADTGGTGPGPADVGQTGAGTPATKQSGTAGTSGGAQMFGR